MEILAPRAGYVPTRRETRIVRANEGHAQARRRKVKPGGLEEGCRLEQFQHKRPTVLRLGIEHFRVEKNGNALFVIEPSWKLETYP